MKNSIDRNSIDFIKNQNIFKNMPYGSCGNVVDNGCGFIACYNLLKYLSYDIDYIDVYNYFNSNKRLNFWGKWGTNPLSVRKLLKRNYNLDLKMSIGKIPTKKYDAYIIMNVYKLQKSNGISAHYVFAYHDMGRFVTHNLTKDYADIKRYLNLNHTIGKLFIVYCINQ